MEAMRTSTSWSIAIVCVQPCTVLTTLTPTESYELSASSYQLSSQQLADRSVRGRRLERLRLVAGSSQLLFAANQCQDVRQLFRGSSSYRRDWARALYVRQARRVRR